MLTRSVLVLSFCVLFVFCVSFDDRSPSQALTQKIAEIKARAQQDLEDLWTKDDTKKASSVPLPQSRTDHGVNNNRAKNAARARPKVKKLVTPTPKIRYDPSLSEMIRRRSTVGANQQRQASGFQ